MGLRASLPELLAGTPLLKRLTWVTAGRLLVFVVIFALVAWRSLDPVADSWTYTIHAMLITVLVGFVGSGVYALIIRRGRGLVLLAYAQIVLDQAFWTMVVYLTGGASSGATSLYGISCVVGAILCGAPGPVVAAASGAAAYVTLVFFMAVGLVSPPPDQPPGAYALTSSDLASYGIFTVFVLVSVAVLSSYLAGRLDRAGGMVKAAVLRAKEVEGMAEFGRLAAGLAHEIRNPLSSISGSIRLLRGGPALDEEDRQLCDIIERETGRLNELVADMLDLARRRPAELVRVDVGKIAREVVELAAKSGRGASDVCILYAGQPSGYVSADDAQLRQLVWNLVRNAVQASSAGDEVTVSLRANERRVTLEVRDYGVGIPSDAQERLFDAFFSTRSQGTGIGLAVVKRIADEHGFEVQVESERGRGASFRVIMPTWRGTDTEPPARDTQP